MRRPSKRFCKYGFLTTVEPYDQEIHNCGATVEERAFNYYNVEEIFLMEEEVRNAPKSTCPCCLDEIETVDNCVICSDGHNIHKTCLTQYWQYSPIKYYYCPLTNTVPRMWDRAFTTKDINA